MSRSEHMLETLQKHWGYSAFRPLQAEIISSILDGEDVLALLPTGAGKSLCFQLPALMQDGLCLVITPLISLMLNQVESLKSIGVNAVAIHSGMRKREIDIVLDNAIYGNTKFLYVSPERIFTEIFLRRLEKFKFSFIAIDEAHCISQWGHDFRPAYLDIAKIKNHLPDIQFVAFTATATREVKKEIIKNLKFGDQFKFFKKSFTKENLSYSAIHAVHKEDEIIRIIGRLEGSGIVYVRNRKLCRDIARTLNGKGVNSAAYHAGLDHVERAEIQQSWMENKARIIVATNAFGMGIDKGDVRFVIHHSLPPSLEEYYQEAGRAGRDEKRAYAILLYNEDDIFSAKRQWRTNYPEFGFIREVYGHLASFFEVAVGSGNEEVYVFDMIEFVNHFQLPLLPTISACKELEKNKWIYLSDAVFEPAKVMIQLNRNELEGSLKQHTKESRLLHLMIRNYESLFSTLVAISIKKLSILMKENVSIVHELLQKLDDAGVILYEPKTDSAQIRFLQDRVGKRNFSIDIKSFKLREEQARKRLKYMIRYVESLNCRENEILVYFSETKLKTCGRCDNCRGKQEVNYQSADLIHLTDMLALNCKDDFCGIEDFVDLFPTNEKKKILQLIDHFIHEGWLELNEYRIKWIKSDD